MAKLNIVNKLLEPKLSFMVNMFIRLPGIITVCILLFISSNDTNKVVPFLPILIQLVFSPINAIYYTIESYKRMIKYRRSKMI